MSDPFIVQVLPGPGKRLFETLVYFYAWGAAYATVYELAADNKGIWRNASTVSDAGLWALDILLWPMMLGARWAGAMTMRDALNAPAHQRKKTKNPATTCLPLVLNPSLYDACIARESTKPHDTSGLPSRCSASDWIPTGGIFTEGPTECARRDLIHRVADAIPDLPVPPNVAQAWLPYLEECGVPRLP